jgi:hypothetical protein
MLYTDNIGLKKPEDSSEIDQQDFNYNSDVIDQKLKEGQQAISLVDILIQGSNLVDESGNNIVDENGNCIVC